MFILFIGPIPGPNPSLPYPFIGGLSPRPPHPPVDRMSSRPPFPLAYRENWPSELILGPFAGGRPSRSSFSMLRFLPLSGDVGIEGDSSPSKGIGIPVSEEKEGVDGDAAYGRYDFVRRTVNSVSTNGGHSVRGELRGYESRQRRRGDAPFSRNSSSCAASSFRISLSGTLCFSSARI